MAAVAEMERTLIVERINVGLRLAKAQGKRIGRPRVSPKTEMAIRKLRGNGLGMLRIARRLGVGVSVVQRVVAS